MPYSMLNKDQMKKILDVADRDLVTIRGLRSLSPRNKLYQGVCRGNQEEKRYCISPGYGMAMAFMVPSAKEAESIWSTRVCRK